MVLDRYDVTDYTVSMVDRDRSANQETEMNAIIGNGGNIIGYTDTDSNEIEIAGAIAASGAPVNIKTFRVSKSATNRAKVSAEMPSAVAHEHGNRAFYTLEG